LFFSESEAYGLALCEANAFGAPCLAASVGSIPTIIREGINGHLFKMPIDVAECAKWISRYMQNWGEYQALTERARAEYDSRLNWEAASVQLLQKIEACLRLKA
jgi:glycosyltransferase involved in cell wall biosynthesis